MDIACIVHYNSKWYVRMFYHREYSAKIFEHSMGARNPVGIGLSYRPSGLHMLAELIPWNRFFGSLKVQKPKGCRKVAETETLWSQGPVTRDF